MTSTEILLIACTGAGFCWLALSLTVVVGRVRHDRRRRERDEGAIGARRARTLLRRARAHRTQGGGWRRAAALVELARVGHPHARRHLYARALQSEDAEVREATVRGLGALASQRPWAVDLLVEALEEERAPRSRVAAQLEALAPRPGWRLERLLGDDRPAVRYWGAMLLARYPTIGGDALRRLTVDADPSVRRAAVESLGTRCDREALALVLRRLDDDVMYVRAHACRAAGAIGGMAVAAHLIPLLADEAWWVRDAAKDTLTALGPDVAPLLEPVLDSPDRFARNGAAEVLQDVGVVDELLRTTPHDPLLARIFDAGELDLRNAALGRIELGGHPVGRQEAA